MAEGDVTTAKKTEWSIRMVYITAVAYLIPTAVTYHLVCLNAPSEIIKEFINHTHLERTGEPMTRDQIESLYGLLVAVVGLGAAVGSLTCDAISDIIGKKYAILIASVTCCVGTTLMVLCWVAKSYELLFIGRTINGLSLGWGLSLAPIYIMEMCLPNQKGVAAIANLIAQSSALLLAQICGYEELLGNSDYWLFLIGFPLVPLGLQLILLPFCPQNPRFLLLKRQDEIGAIKVLQLIRSHDDVTDEIKQIRTEMAESYKDTQISIFKMFLEPNMRIPLIVTIVMSVQQIWCGVNGILLFSGMLFRDVGVSDRSARYASSGTGLVCLLSNVVAALLIHRFRRKTLFGGSMAIIGVFSAVFALTTVYQEQVEFLKYVNIVVSLLIVATFGLGVAPVIWVLIGEMFPHNARGAGFSVAVFCAFVSFFVHCYALPVMIEAMSSYTFFVFAGLDAIMVVFCVFVMPETRGNNIDQNVDSSDTSDEVKENTESPLDLSYLNAQGEHYPNGINIVTIAYHQSSRTHNNPSNPIDETLANDTFTRL